VVKSFLDQEGVKVEQCIHEDRHLLELLRDDVEHLLDHLLVRDVITEDAQLASHVVEVQREVFNRLTGLERDVTKLTLKLLGVGFLDLVGAYTHLLNRFLGFRRRELHR
jgi:hypothetical protein